MGAENGPVIDDSARTAERSGSSEVGLEGMSMSKPSDAFTAL
jgi:hypothetical protein